MKHQIKKFGNLHKFLSWLLNIFLVVGKPDFSVGAQYFLCVERVLKQMLYL